LARISTHILDTSRGLPAHGIAVELHLVKGAERRLMAAVTTNADGRTDAPLVSSDSLETGVYELSFHAADYFHRMGVTLPNPPFLGVIVIRIGIADAGGNYHVPLLVSPYAYSTYRGS
jgi:5-hydroxyisourate hydrolase